MSTASGSLDVIEFSPVIVREPKNNEMSQAEKNATLTQVIHKINYQPLSN